MTVLPACVLISLALTTNAFQPNCDPYNQFRNYCFSVEYCDRFSCYESSCGKFSFYSQLVRLKKTKLIPKCAFTNSATLETIDGRNSGIEVLASGAFRNLTGNLQIDLSLNKIKELHSDIFYNVLAHSLDLSWNQILYIQEGAFAGLPKLTTLNLSKNVLKTFPIHQLPPKLSVIDISYNFLEEAILTSRRMPSLTKIDIGNNFLNRIAFSLDNPVQKINLFDNRLQTLDVLDLPFCEELNIGKNNFHSPPKFLNVLNLQKISIYPNPWQCDALRDLWTTLQNNFVTLIDSHKATSSVCSVEPKLTSPQRNISSQIKSAKQIYCQEDSDCSEQSACRSHRCWNLCSIKKCRTGEECVVAKHELKCSCPKGTKKDIREYNSACQNVECFFNTDCSSNYYCNDEHICKSFDFNGASPGSGSFSGDGGYGVSYGGYSGSYGGYGTSNFSIGGSGLDNFPIDSPEEEWWRHEISETKEEKDGKI